MIKKVFGRKLSRSRPAREALFASLVRALVVSGKIVTTKAKAKAIRGMVEGYLHSARGGALNARRRIISELKNDSLTVKTLFEKKFKSVKLVNLPVRKGDSAEMVRLELTEEVKEVKKEAKKDENVSTKRKRS